VNGYGCSGLPPDAEFHTNNLLAATALPSTIASSAAISESGDVIVIELESPISSGASGAPVEITQSIWVAIRNAADAGIIVVEAAGNGMRNLDAPFFAAYQSWGDSGAIIVGAGEGYDPLHYKKVISTFGSRVNVQGWGGSVFTLAYGDVRPGNPPTSDPNQWYTLNGLNSTSAATAMVAGAILSLQSYAVNRLCRPLTPAEMRSLLISTGWPQGNPAAGNVGPFPQMREAIQELKLLPSNCQFRRGDANGSGAVDQTDVIYINYWLCCGGAAPVCMEAADANDDGSIDFTDGAYISNWLWQGGVPPPAPGPFACGPDPVTSVENPGCTNYTACP